jgi:putative hydrolase of HD superfamily
MALFALLAHPHLEHPVDLHRTLKMVLVHDLVEAEVGDVPFFADDTARKQKVVREQAAIHRVREKLSGRSGEEIYELFQEYEQQDSTEARFAKALDNLEVQLQHNLADLSTWEEIEYELVYTKMDPHCEHDQFLKRLCEAIKVDAEQKLKRAGIDVERVRKKKER